VLLLVVLALLVAVFSTSNAPSVHASLYWFHGVRTSPISVCFVGNALTSRPGRVQQILTYLQEFEYAANIQFNYLGTCPSPTTLPGGGEYYDGDIRVVIPSIDVSGTGPVPGVGCPMFNQLGPGGYNGDNDGWGSWSNAPDDLAANRSCLYNLKLGDDPWNDTPYLNHTLHEFGHALGLAHEHVRLDATCYNPSSDARSTSQGYLTPYDMYSVMHYKFQTSQGHTCDTPGNYGHAGFTELDKLALHILYPEDNRVAEFVGTTVIRAGDTLRLQSAWKARGANMAFVAHSFAWKLNNVTYSTTPDLVIALSTPGEYTLEFSHSDFLGRTYTYTGQVRVLRPAEYDQQIVAPVAASLPLHYPNLFLSTFGGTLDLAPGMAMAIASETFTDTVVVDYVPQAASNAAAPTGGLKDVGVFYSLDVHYLSTGKPAQLPAGQTYSVTVAYKQEEVPPLVDESNLGLYFWDEGSWQRDNTSVANANANTVHATPAHFSSWAILAEVHDTYLPVALKEVGPPLTGQGLESPPWTAGADGDSCLVDRMR
jgi:hypothetical protein